MTTRGGSTTGGPPVGLPPAPAGPPMNPPTQAPPQAQPATAVPNPAAPVQPAGGAPNPPAQAPPVAAFARTPAQAAPGIINYSTRMGERLYQSATSKLDDDRYDGSAEGLFPFLGLIKERARKFGWDQGIMQIPDPAGGPDRYLLNHYGTVTLAEIRRYERSYITAHNREAQDMYLLYECLMNSLSPEAKAKINIWRDDFWVHELPSGNLLMKVIIRECHLDTNATVASIRQRLSSLDTYLPTIDYDIAKLNMYVKTLLDQLSARGETSTDMLSNLFTGYMAAKDKSFVAYIDKKLELYEEGTHISPNQLMLWARQKYDLLRDKGVWNAPTPEEEKILALTAQVNKMSEKLKAGRVKKDQRPQGSTESVRKMKPKPEWFEDEPSDPSKPITWNNKKWHWCGAKTGGKCESYVRHKPEQCRGKKRGRKQNDGKEKRPRGTEAVVHEAIQSDSDGSDPYISS